MKRVLLVSGIGLLVLSAVLLIDGLVQFIIPPTFESVARIHVKPEADNVLSVSGPSVETNSFDPYWFQKEVEKLQATTVLYEVITNLDLNLKWGQKFKEGELRTDLTYALLKKQVDILQSRGTALIEIHVRSDDPTEASTIANSIAEVYRTQGISREKEKQTAGVKDLTGVMQKTVSSSPKIPAVEIIDQAEPNLRPVKPHPLMKILVPAAGLIAGVLGVVLLMVAVMRKDGDKESRPPLPT